MYSTNHSSDSSSLGSPLWSSPSPLSHATVPFSWEQQPGIPKQHKGSTVRATRSKLSINFTADQLRPPPPLSRSCEAAGNYDRSAWPRHKSKKAAAAEVEGGTQGDPFMAALVECTKQQNDHKISVKTPEGSNRKKKSSIWVQLSSVFSCTGSSSSTRSSQINLSFAKPEKLMRPDRTLSDLIRRAKGKMSDDHVSAVPQTKQSGLAMSKLSEGLPIGPADQQMKRSSTCMLPVAYEE